MTNKNFKVSSYFYVLHKYLRIVFPVAKLMGGGINNTYSAWFQYCIYEMDYIYLIY